MTSPAEGHGLLPSVDGLAAHIAADGERQREGWYSFDLRPAQGVMQPSRPTITAGTPAIDLPAQHAQSIRSLVGSLRADGLVESWFFVRKPPGYRVRLLRAAAAPPMLLEAAVEAWSTREGADLEMLFAVYEPEQARFGGRAGMKHAHRHFDCDSDAALDFAAMGDQAARPCTAERLSASLINDLLGRIVDDRAELFDVWRRLADALSSVCRVPLSRFDPDLDTARASMAPDLAPVLPVAVHPLVGRVQRSNQRLSVEVRAAREDVAVRSWGAQVTVFHWNRFGLTTEELGPLVAGMCAVLEP